MYSFSNHDHPHRLTIFFISVWSYASNFNMCPIPPMWMGLSLKTITAIKSRITCWYIIYRVCWNAESRSITHVESNAIWGEIGISVLKYQNFCCKPLQFLFLVQMLWCWWTAWLSTGHSRCAMVLLYPSRKSHRCIMCVAVSTRLFTRLNGYNKREFV